MLFLAIAVAYAETLGISEVFYGAQRHDIHVYWDTTPDFLTRLNEVYQLNRKTPVRIRAPFVEYSKADILRIGFELNVDYADTWLCYRGMENACGQCPTCQGAAFWDVQAVYERIRGYTPRLLLASFTTHLFGEFTNSLVLSQMKVATKGRWLWTRTIGQP